ncbi:MAG: hypothetical protein RIS34_1428 [Pseudomonadota bacterium]
MFLSLQSFANTARIISLIAVVLLVGACSAIKIGYNNAPELAYWWLDAYADFNDAQTVKVRDELARLHQWHRATELPRLADLLQKMQRLAPTDVTPEQVCGLYTDLRSRLDATTVQAGPAVVALATSLTPAQLAHIEARFDKTNTQWREEWLDGSLAQQQTRRLKSLVERFERIYPTLEEPQLAVLRAFIASASFDPQLNYTEHVRRQQDLLQTLRQINGLIDGNRLSNGQATAALHAYLERSANPASSPNPAYRAHSEKSLPDSCKAFAQLHNSTTPEQRDRTGKRLAAYERDARDLAAQR